MKLTKYQHACLCLETDTGTLIVDLGTLTKDFIMPKRVDAVVITHEHGDHFDEARLQEVFHRFPKATLIAPAAVTARFPTITTRAVSAGDSLTVADFSLDFFGGEHAVIFPEAPVIANIGVLINGTLYYPGDSLAAPDAAIGKILALPVSAPWLKASEAAQLLAQLTPHLAFPTHDAILSDDGKGIVDRLIGTVAAEHHVTYRRLDGGSITIEKPVNEPL